MLRAGAWDDPEGWDEEASRRKGLDKEVMVHVHNEILLRYKKNIFESVLTRWVKLEPTIQSEVSQKEKHQYSILTHIYGI